MWRRSFLNRSNCSRSVPVWCVCYFWSVFRYKECDVPSLEDRVSHLERSTSCIRGVEDEGGRGRKKKSESRRECLFLQLQCKIIKM